MSTRFSDFRSYDIYDNCFASFNTFKYMITILVSDFQVYFDDFRKLTSVLKCAKSVLICKYDIEYKIAKCPILNYKVQQFIIPVNN